MRDVLSLKRPSLREIFSRFVPLRGIFSSKVVGDVGIATSKYQMSTSQHLNISTSKNLTTSHHFTTNFLFFVMYTPGFSPSSDSPLERTFLPVRS